MNRSPIEQKGLTMTGFGMPTAPTVEFLFHEGDRLAVDGTLGALDAWEWSACATSPSGVWRVRAIGPTRGSALVSARLADVLAGGFASVGALMQHLTRHVGSHIIVVTAPQGTYVRGNIAGSARAFFARVGGRILVADRADVLATAVGAPLDPLALTANLLEPVGHPFDRLSPWVGVMGVPPGEMLHVAHDGTCTLESWWCVPDADVPLDEGAARVASALRAAVVDLVGEASRVVSDLSGGLDSTAVTAIAAELRPGSVRALTIGDHTTSEDERWARLGASLLPVEHQLIQHRSLPLVMSGVDDAVMATDLPTPAITSGAIARRLARVSEDAGATVHLTGHGGDHIFIGHPTVMADVLRSHPWQGLRRIRAYADMFSWPTGATLAAVLRPDSYRSWLGRCLDREAAVTVTDPLLTWGLPVTIPAWVRPEAVAKLDAWAQGTPWGPLAPRRGAHAELDAIRQGAAFARGIFQVSAQVGTPQVTPFFDDRVVEAALAVRPIDRVTPWEYKPLLKAAMAGIVPARLLDRDTKDEGSREVDQGMRIHHDAIRSLLAAHDCVVEQLGLVDGARLREALVSPSHPDLVDGAIVGTVAVEYWIKAHAALGSRTQ